MWRNQLNSKRLSSRSQVGYQSLESRNLLAAITVNTLTDNGDLSDGLISLREAITATNTNAPFGDAPAGDVDGDSIRIDPALAGQTIELPLVFEMQFSLITPLETGQEFFRFPLCPMTTIPLRVC